MYEPATAWWVAWTARNANATAHKPSRQPMRSQGLWLKAGLAFATGVVSSTSVINAEAAVELSFSVKNF